MFRKKSLTQDELDKAMEKLRARYDHYITSYMKPMKVKSDFESRYSQALASRMNMELFIQGELEMLEELFQHEEEREEKEDQEEHTRQKRQEKYGDSGYFQKVVEDQDREMEKYPFLKLHPHASKEMGFLFGAINDFEKNFWRALESFLMNVFPSERNNALATMDQNLWRCTHCRSGQVPVILERYVMMLDSEELYGDLIHESQICIKEAAFLLHDIRNAIQASWELGYEDERISFAYAMILNMIQDFRLKDIKKNKGEQLWQK